MKRIWANIIYIVMTIIFWMVTYFVSFFAGTIILKLVNFIFSSTTTIILFMLIGGGVGITPILFFTYFMASIPATISEKICESRSGTRFLVVGILIIIYSGVMLISTIFLGQVTFINIFVIVTVLFYGVFSLKMKM